MQQYLIRFLKYILYFAIILVIMLCLVFYTSDHGDLKYFWELIPMENTWQMALFLVAFALVYPLIGFSDRKVYLNHPFKEDRDELIDCILRANYAIASEEDGQIVFRHKSPFLRAMRMFEDKIVLDYSDNPIALKGMRRDVYRFARNMEYIIRKQTTD